jgi:YYY domain-containing protein
MLILSILNWWFLLQIFGLAGLPLAFRLLGGLPDRGYAFARPLGLLLSGYLLWLGGSLGFWRNSAGGTLLAIPLVAGAGVWLYRTRPDKSVSIAGWLRAHKRYWLAVELLFAAALAGWTVYKAYNPNLETAGGEKWMEIAFINATLRSDTFPPQDPWLAGYGISYYYFGYVLMAMVTRLSGLPSTVAYNLFVPALFALTLTGAFSIVYNLASSRAGTGGEEGEAGRPVVGFGLLGALFVGILGNPEGLLEVLHSRGLLPARFWQWLDILDINQPPTPGGWIPTRFIWWWRGSRVIHDCSLLGLVTGDCNPPNNWEVIDEFPFFSFLLGDVHPHVLALPFVLLAIGLALNLLLRRPAAEPARTESPGYGSLFSRLVSSGFGGWPQFLLYAVCLGALGFLNTWDFPIYLFVVTLAFVFRRVRSAPGESRGDGSNRLAEGLGAGLGLGVLGGLLYLPFYLSFQSQAQGILPNLINPTRLPQFLVFFGPFLFVVISYLAVLSREQLSAGWTRRLPGALAVTLLGPVLAMLAVGAVLAVSPSARAWVEGLLNKPEVQAVLGEASLGSLAALVARVRLGNPWTFLLLAGLLAWVLALATREAPVSEARPRPALAGIPGRVESSGFGNPPRASGVVSASSAAGSANPAESGGLPNPSRASGEFIRFPAADTFALILIGVGLLLPLAVEFVYLRDLFGHRMNTVFKFYFQAWVLLGLAAAYGAAVVAGRLRGAASLGWRLALALLVTAGLVYPLLAIPNKAGNFSSEPTLDGMAWLEWAHPDDYAAIRWLQANAPDGAVVLEASGGSYSYYGRVSALTGLPTVLGWDFHEYQWRGSYDEPASRKPDVDILYNSVDPAQTLTLLDKYAITYVYVGPLEREQYHPAGLDKFDRLLEAVYRQGNVTIYRR